jgi:hypothetical protein
LSKVEEDIGHGPPNAPSRSVSFGNRDTVQDDRRFGLLIGECFHHGVHVGQA